MERHRCKLCYRKFSNGRALGGHMRSHMMNLPLVPKLDPAPPPQPQLQPQPQPPPQSGCETESSTQSPSMSHYSSDSEHEDQTNSAEIQHVNEDEVDMFVQSTTTEPTWSSSLVAPQDRESETESLKKNPTRRRSKRSSSSNFHCDYTNTTKTSARRSIYSHIENEYHHQGLYEGAGGAKENNRPKSVSPVSSISEVTSDTDLAYCLMMMSRDKWTTNNSSESKYKNVYGLSTSRVKKKYKCETCNKVFRSYQALGGHRASHKKFRTNENFELHGSNNLTSKVEEILELPRIEKEVQEQQQQKKVHECPVCLRVFSSGQALGGHKRSHVIINGCDYSTNQDYSTPLSNFNDDESPKKMKMMMAINSSNHTTNESISLIDLNLPAPVDYGDDNEEEISQIDDVHL